jgi:hypothetical protein
VADYDNPEYMLRSSIWFALRQCRYQPPKTHDATARDAYYGKVADKVIAQIELSGWLIERQTLQKSRPRNYAIKTLTCVNNLGSS